MRVDQAEQIADTVITYRSNNRWFLPGVRDKLIHSALNASRKSDLVDCFSRIMEDHEIDDPFNDPCDECKADRWFYFHPALVL